MKKLKLCIYYLIIGIIFTNTAAATSGENIGGKISLLGIEQGEKITAALKIELKEGWKTYWKNPGGSGIAPRLSFKESKNLKNIILRLPKPKFFKEDKSIGYKKNAMFIIEGEKSNKEKNSVVSITGTIGVCEKICVPVEINLQLEVKDKKNEQIENAIKNLPSKQSKTIKIKNAKRKGDELIITTSASNKKSKQIFTTAGEGVATQIGENEFKVKLYGEQKRVDILFIYGNMAIEKTMEL